MEMTYDDYFYNFIIWCISCVKLVRLYGNANICKYHANGNSMSRVELSIEYKKIGMAPLTGASISRNTKFIA